MLLCTHIALYLCLACFPVAAGAGTELVIATGELPPFVSEQPGKSCLTEIFRAVAQEMGVTFVFKFMPWKRCELAVEEGKAWGMMPYIRTPEREKKFLFSERLFTRQAKLFYYSPDGKSRTIPYTELKDLKRYKIGGVRGYYYEKLFRDAGIELDLVTTEEQNFRKLGARRIDLAPADETLGWYTINTLLPREKTGRFFTLNKPLNVSDGFLMTSRRHPQGREFLARFNTALKKVKRDGSFQKILDRHGLTLAY